MYLQFIPLLFLPTCLQQYIGPIVDVCDWDIYDCDYPYDIEVTEMFKCNSDSCPVNFKCCSHRCFVHNICQPYKEITPEPQRLVESAVAKPGVCNILLSCDIDLPAGFIRQFECLQDDNCPDHFKCCYIECYGLKVCQPAKYDIIFHFDNQVHTSSPFIHTQSTIFTSEQPSIIQETTSMAEDNSGNDIDDDVDEDDDFDDDDESSGNYPTEMEISSTVSYAQEMTDAETTTTGINQEEEMNIIETTLTTHISTQATDKITTRQREMGISSTVSSAQETAQAETTATTINADEEMNITGTILTNVGTQTTQEVTQSYIPSTITTENDDDFDDNFIESGDFDNEDGNVESSGDNEENMVEATTKIISKNEVDDDLVSSGDSDDEDGFETNEVSQSLNRTDFHRTDLTNITETQNVPPESTPHNMDTATTVVYPTRSASNETTVINVEIISEAKQTAGNTDTTINYIESSREDVTIAQHNETERTSAIVSIDTTSPAFVLKSETTKPIISEVRVGHEEEFTRSVDNSNENLTNNTDFQTTTTILTPTADE